MILVPRTYRQFQQRLIEHPRTLSMGPITSSALSSRAPTCLACLRRLARPGVSPISLTQTRGKRLKAQGVVVRLLEDVPKFGRKRECYYSPFPVSRFQFPVSSFQIPVSSFLFPVSQLFLSQLFLFQLFLFQLSLFQLSLSQLPSSLDHTSCPCLHTYLAN